MNDENELQNEVSATEGLSSAKGANCNDLLCWRPIDDAAKSGRKVLLSLLNIAGKRRTIVGFWVNKFSIEDNNEEWHEEEEKDGTYYWREGWYESMESHDDYSCLYAGIKSITHWMPLPKFTEAI